MGIGLGLTLTPNPFLCILLNLDDRNAIKQCLLIAAKHTFLATEDTFPWAQRLQLRQDQSVPSGLGCQPCSSISFCIQRDKQFISVSG